MNTIKHHNTKQTPTQQKKIRRKEGRCGMDVMEDEYAAKIKINKYTKTK